MSVCDSASVDIERDGTIAASETATASETDFSPCNPQANSTVIDAIPIESGYLTKESEATNLPLNDEVDFLGEMLNGQELGNTDKTVVENPNPESASGGTASIGGKREQRLTERGKSYKLAQSVRERKKLKREIQAQIANIQTLMGLNKNLEQVSQECIKLNERFKLFGDLHEEIQDLLSGEEQAQDHQVYINLHEEIVPFREVVRKWMTNAEQQIRDEEREKNSTKSSVKSKNSKASRASTTSSRARALEAKAKEVELKTRIAQLDQVETAKREAERTRLMAECAIAAAVSKVYEDAIKEDAEQYLGSDDPDNDDANMKLRPTKERPLQPSFNSATGESVGALNPYAPEFTHSPPPPLQSQANTGLSSATRHVDEHKDCAAVRNTLGNVQTCRESSQVEQTSSYKETGCEPQATFWERMELRLSQPPPEPAPFDGDPAKYLRFRANFRDQVESKKSLSDSEKMNYLMSYTTGRAKSVIENYNGLPNGCQLALKVLEHRFGQGAMIVQALKSSVTDGPKIRPGDNAALLALSDKIENCCWAMTELRSCELDCTTNLRQIYDRLPGHLQGKWRKTAMSYRERSGGREPDLRELSKFITAQSLIENDPVYSRKGEPQMKSSVGRNPNRRAPEERPGPMIPTLATEIRLQENGGNQETKKPVTPSEQGSNGSNCNQGEHCKVCKGAHAVPKCSVFLSKGVGWRRRFARFKALCYRCLSHTHLQRNCPEKTSCTEKDCARPQDHHSLLHISTKNEIEDVKGNTEQSSPAVPNLSVNNATTENNRRSFVLLKVVPLRVSAENGRTLTTYGLLDSAAVSSMITSNMADKLQLQGVPEKVSINTVTQRDQDLELSKVKFQVSSTSQGSPSFPVYHALTVKSLNVSDRYCPSQLDLSPWPHLNGLQLPNIAVDVNEVSVLIGQDVPQVHIVLDYCWGDNPQSQPYGMKTPFGWCVAGPTNRKEDENKPVALSVFEFDWAEDKRDMELHEQVERFWALESHGFSNDGDTSNSLEDERAFEILKKTTKLKDGKYEVGLLWRNDNPELPNNRVQAEKRLQQLKRRFQRSPEFAAQYKTVMNDYIDKGYAVKLSEEEAARTSSHTWYLPHHGVINPNKSKVRVVYDAAARFEGTALNKELLQGPQLNNSLVGVLMRFRKDEVAVASDIESMFHRVACREDDTDALRFLWWSDSLDEPPSDYKMTVHLFGKADSPCIAAWALQQTAADNEAAFGEEICEIVKKNFYVDDSLFSKPSTEQAVHSSLELMRMLRKGNFRLTKFISNDKDVLAAIPAEERTIKNLDLDKLPIERALGQQWKIDTDTFGVKTSPPSGRPGNDTRRGCLSTLSSIFDPLGMIGPVLLPAKRVLQKTWQLKLHWDEKLPEDLLKDWNKWREDLTLLNHVSIPRCYFPGGCSLDATFQLHHFSDASEVGYGTVSYLRRETVDGRVDCSFIMAKSRTAPLQFVSVPRLELQAATIAVRMHRLILKEIDLAISASFFWTDSKITLQYINNETRRFKTYVANRVAEIRDASQPCQWRHCPGSLNPADEASRGIPAQRLLTSERWFKGPAFLIKPEEDWPCFEIEALPEDDQELKGERAIFTLTLPEKLHELLVKYSSWTVLQRKIAWLLKFKAYLQYRKDEKADIEKNLTTADLENATLTIVKLVQREVYAEEIQDLETRGHVKRSSKIVKLRPILDDCVMRVGGRIADAPIAFDAKFPMIVPPKHHVAQLLIASFHQKLLHAGQNHVLAHLREKFWIPNGRSAVRKVVRSCMTCKKQRAATMEQMMSALPAFRTTAYEPCFTYTGVDYFGPLNVKKGRSVVKRWGAIFTCMNSRAIHLELATSLESDCFINVFRRFVNRRGPPKFMYSDNGTNFVGAEREIRQAIENWNQRQIKDELLQRGCQWVFQPPKASHASGVWERLIRSTRTALKAMLGESLVEEDVLATVLTEAEAILNSRPLCAVSDDPNDLQPLTPNHLLLQRTVSALPPGTFVKEDILLRKKWRQTQILADHFWRRWLKEYVPALQERQKWHRPRRNAQVGDLVLLVDQDLPRGRWHLGRIVRVIPGRDGLVRTVEVKTGSSSSLLRPIQKLCLLEEAENLYRD